MSIHEVKFDFTKYSGMNLIQGDNLDIVPIIHNGAGKTAFFSALYFGLYGETLQDINIIKTIHHRKFLFEPIEIIVELETLGKQYILITRIESQTSPITLSIIENGVEITKPSLRESREFLQKFILRISPEIFKRRVILLQDNATNFFDMRKAERHAFIEENFALDVFGKIASTIHQDSIAIQREITLKEKQIKQLERTLTDLRESEKNLKAQLTTRKKDISSKIVEKSKEISELFDNLQGEELNKKIKTTEDGIRDLQTCLNDLENKIKKIDLSMMALSQTNAQKEKHIKKYKEVVDFVCNTCKEKIQKQFGDIDSNEENKKIKDMISQLQISRVNHLSNSSKIRNMLSTLNTKFLKLSSLKSDLKNLVHKLEEDKIDISPVSNMIEKGTVEYKICSQAVEEHVEQYRYLDFAEFVMSEDGVKKYVVKNILKLLNDRIRYYLLKLGSNYFCSFDDSFNCTFQTESGACEFNNFSSGERMRIRMATLFAFRDLLFDQLLVDYNILVVDEFFDSSLDSYAINKMLEILTEIAEKQKITVFIISHRKEIKFNQMFATKQIKFIKKFGISTIDEQ